MSLPRSLRLSFACLTFACLALAVAATPAAPNATELPALQGTVVDESGNPVPNTKVTIAYLAVADEQTTSESGSFQFRIGENAADAIVATLTAHAPDGRFWVGSVPIRPNSVNPLTVTVKAGRDLAVTVSDADGRPVAAAQ